MSKIALFQHTCQAVLKLPASDPDIAELLAAADAAHVKWQTDGSGYWACSDQFIDGVAKGSRYYPRIVTAALWLDWMPPAATDADDTAGTMDKPIVTVTIGKAAVRVAGRGTAARS
jgi:hypothetical protein